MTAASMVLASPDSALLKIKRLVLDSVSSVHSRRAYDKALTDFLAWGRENGIAFTKSSVQQYKTHLEQSGLASSTVNVRLTAVRRLAAEAADNGLLDPALATGIGRVKGVKRSGVRTGNWLTREQAEQLILTPNAETLRGKRDRAILALLIGCGLRRSEASEICFSHIQQRDGRWAIVDLVGKGDRIRTVPMPSWCKLSIDEWATAAGIDSGRVFRPMAKGGKLVDGVLLPQNILNLVQRYAGQIPGFPQIAPHDLRRTFAKLAHKGSAALEQIQLSLGHASIQTTERYLGVKQDLSDAPCDHLGLRLGK